MSETRYRAVKEAKEEATIIRFTSVEAFKKQHPKTPETVCYHCGTPETSLNPLTVAHRIPDRAVLQLGLTSGYVGKPSNLVWAHRDECNKAVEFSTTVVMRVLASEGVVKVPSYWSSGLEENWKHVIRGIPEAMEVIRLRQEARRKESEPEYKMERKRDTEERLFLAIKTVLTLVRPVKVDGLPEAYYISSGQIKEQVNADGMMTEDSRDINAVTVGKIISRVLGIRPEKFPREVSPLQARGFCIPVSSVEPMMARLQEVLIGGARRAETGNP